MILYVEYATTSRYTVEFRHSVVQTLSHCRNVTESTDLLPPHLPHIVVFHISIHRFVIASDSCSDFWRIVGSDEYSGNKCVNMCAMYLYWLLNDDTAHATGLCLLSMELSGSKKK